MQCRSLQGECIGEKSEYECTFSFFVVDFQITAKDVGPCEGGETYFGSDPKKDYKSDLQSPIEPHNEKEDKATPLGCEPENLVEEKATIVSLHEEDNIKHKYDKIFIFAETMSTYSHMIHWRIKILRLHMRDTK